MSDKSGAPPERQTVSVWDPVVRIGHWVIVIGFFTAYLSGDEWLSGHVWAGYAVATVVAVRTIWGFVGPKHARFTSFVRGPNAVIEYISGLRSGTAKRHLGHNPAGAAMIMALLVSLSVTTVSGMALLAVEEGQGPLAGIVSAQWELEAERPRQSISYEYLNDDDEYDDHRDDDEDAEELLEGIHSAFTYLTLGLIALHILGVILSSVAHKENLVFAMVTGRKRPDE